MKYAKIIVELSTLNNTYIDSEYEFIIILLHLKHDGPVYVKNHRFVDDSPFCDNTHGFMYLELSEFYKNNAIKILRHRGYAVTEVQL